MRFDLSIMTCRCRHLSFFFFREPERSQFCCKVFEVCKCRLGIPLLEEVLHDHNERTAAQTRIYFRASKSPEANSGSNYSQNFLFQADSDVSIPLEVTAPADWTLNHRFISFALALLVGLWDVLRAFGARF